MGNVAQTADELIRIQLEVMSGLAWGDPRSKITPTAANQKTWEACERDIADMRAAGVMPDIPHDIDLDPPPPA